MKTSLSICQTIVSTIKEDQLEALKQAITDDKYIQAFLVEVLKYRLSQIDVRTISADFDDTAWSYKQAFKEGQKSMIDELINFINKE